MALHSTPGGVAGSPFFPYLDRMTMRFFPMILLGMVFLASFPVLPQEERIAPENLQDTPSIEIPGIVENFNSLDLWEDLTFPKISRHSVYEIVTKEGESYLELRSDGSASGKVLRRSFDPYQWSRLSWRWKIENFPHDEEPMKKEGDDYPVRIYVLFEYDPENPGSAGRFRYEVAKLIYGAYPPHSTLNFVWSNRRASRDHYRNPYTDRAMMVVRDRGTEASGKWREHEVDILEEYRKAFGEDPPHRATLAVMADTDNTGTRSRAWIDYIRVGAK